MEPMSRPISLVRRPASLWWQVVRKSLIAVTTVIATLIAIGVIVLVTADS